MNVSFGTLLVIVVATTAAAILVVLSPTWSRNRRARHLATVDMLLATSYIGATGGSSPSPTSAGATEAPRRPVEPGRADDGADRGQPGSAVTEPDRPASSLPADAMPGRDSHRTLLDAGGFEQVIEREDAREERYRRPTTVVMLELDGLERLVDRLGPVAADRLEPDVADTISRLARRADYVARLAPGRFAVLMPETDEIVAINYVERIRQACDQWLESGAIAMRLAIGWASTTGSASVTTAMQVATDRMHVELRRHARVTADGSSGGPPGA